MKYILIGCILFFSLLAQVTITTIPFILVALLLLYIYSRNELIFFLGFFCGILLDLLQVRTIGFTSLFFLFFLFFVFLYQRKFEIGSYYFIFLILVIGSFFYAVVFAFSDAVFMALVTALLGVFCFWLIEHLKGKKKHDRYMFN